MSLSISNIYQHSAITDYQNLNDEKKTHFVKTHWVHTDGHISKKNVVGKFLNSWAITRYIFRKFCKIDLSQTFEHLQKKKTNAHETSEQKQFNETCEFLIDFISHTSLKNRNKDISDLKNLKISVISQDSSNRVTKVIQEIGKNVFDDSQAKQMLLDSVASLPQDEKYEAVREIFKRADPKLSKLAFATKFLDNDDSAKVAGLSQNNNALKEVLADSSLHDTIANGLDELGKKDLPLAFETVEKLERYIPDNASKIKEACKKIAGRQQELDKPFKEKMQFINTLPSKQVKQHFESVTREIATSYSEDRHSQFAGLTRYLAPEHAVSLFKDFNYSYVFNAEGQTIGLGSTGAMMEGLADNPLALKEVLKTPSLNGKILKELESLAKSQPSKAAKVVDQMQDLSLIPQFVKTLESENAAHFGMLFAKLPSEKAALLIDALPFNDPKIPVVAANIVRGAIPEFDWAAAVGQVVETKGIAALFTRSMEDIPSPFDNSQWEKISQHLTPQQGAETLILMAAEFKERFVPEAIVGMEENSWHDKITKMHTQQNAFLEGLYANTVSSSYIEGYEKMTNSFADVARKLIAASQLSTAIKAIKNEPQLVSNIFLLLLLQKLDPAQSLFVAEKAHFSHDFALLYLNMTDEQRKQALPKRISKISDKTQWEMFYARMLSFCPVTQRNTWKIALDSLKPPFF